MVTIQSNELKKLRLSERLARRIAIETGVSLDWLLAGDYRTPPICPREPGETYSKRHYLMTRAEITDPRTDPFDLAQAENVLADAAWQLAGSLLTAYRKDQTVYYYGKLRETLESFRLEFPPTKDLRSEQDLGELTGRLHKLLVKAADAKKRVA
jgi:hypothetical protein